MCRLHSVILCASALALAPCIAGQSLGAAFVNDYELTTLPAVPGVPTGTTGYGGITFKFTNPNVLLINGQTNGLNSAIYEIPVVRDDAGRIVGFAGTATFVSSAPDADGGLDYASNGVLMYTTWPSNMIGQIKLGSTSPDRLDDLTMLGGSGTTGALRITPPGFPNAGRLRVTTYSNDGWYSADLAPDGAGTWDILNFTQRSTLPPVCSANGSETMIYVDATYPGFTAQSVLVSNWDCSSVGAYAIDAQGDIDTAIPRREFLSGYNCSGGTMDPMTGAFVFPDYNGTGLVVVSPRTEYGSGCGGLTLRTNLARLGWTWHLATSNYPAGSTLALQTLSVTKFDPGIALGSFGMTACEQLTGTEATVLLTPQSQTTQFAFPMPFSTGFLGTRLTSQSYALAPGANPAGAISSNAAEATIGN